MEGGDLQVKYQKIAAEYSKLRAQASVLKKAVVEEQGRNAELRDVLREREQSLRKSTQEMESLTFRNQQLTKRVTVLQDELESRDARPKKGKVRSTENNHDDDSRSVIGEELQMKIAENVRLVTMIHDNEAAYQQQIATLNQRVETLEYDLQKGNKENIETEKKYRSLIFKLENDKVSLLKGFGDSSDSLSDMTDAGDGAAECGSLNAMFRAGIHVKELAAAFAAYHSTTEQRLHCTQKPLTPASAKFSSYLKESGPLLQETEREYSALEANIERATNPLSAESWPGLQSFSAKLTAFTNHLHKLIPCHQLSLEEETSNDSRLGTINNEIELQLKSITNQFFKLNSYVKLFSVQGRRSAHASWSSHRRFLSELADAAKALLGAMRGLAVAHAAKTAMLAELGPAHDGLAAIDERMGKAAESMVSSTEKLLKILSDHRLLTSVPAAPTNGSSAFHESASDEATEAEDPVAAASVSAGSREALVKQLETCRLRATKLEQDKEHWHLEFKLLHMKHEKRTTELEEQLSLLRGPGTEANDEQTQENNSYSATTMTNLLGRLGAPFALTAEMEARETEVKRYLTRRIDHLLEQRQLEETRALTLATECAVLQRRLELSTSGKRQGDGRLREATDRATRLHEELQTTAHNYETQLSTMSEHLANLNDTLTMQRDQIEQLKYQLDNKPSRKGKQK